MVNELVNKLNVKPFKRIRVIRTIGGKVANAMVTGINNRELILTEKLLEVLDKDELKAVLAHEVTHHKYKHVELSMIIWVVTGILIFSAFSYGVEYLRRLRYSMIDSWETIFFIVYMVLYIIAFASLILISRYFTRRAERKADLEAAKLVEDPRAYIRALAKITVVNLGPMKVGKILEKFETHPPPLKRMLEAAKVYNISEEEVKEIINNVVNELSKAG